MLGSGTYFISFFAIERNPLTGLICFEYQKRDSVKLMCNSNLCKCGTFTGLNYRPTQGAATRFISCGDTLAAVCNLTSFNWTLGGNFQCMGDSCRPVVPMTWTLTGPAGTFTQSGTMSGPNFSLSLASAYLTTSGMYNLALTALCGTDTCRCNFKIIAAGCPKDTCATRPCVGNLTWQNILNATFIKDMVTYQGKLIIGGSFTLLGNNNIAAWDGTNWTSLGTGINGSVNALAVHNGLLYAGGTFSSPGNNIAVWNGTAWAALGTGMNTVPNGGVFSLLSNGSELIAGGLFTTAGGSAASNIARWNGTSWSNLNTGTNGLVSGLGLYNNQLVAGGVFTTAGGNSTVNNIARWNGFNWLSLGGGINLFAANKGQGVSAILQLGSELIVGGRFMEASNGSSVANTQFITKWDGTLWSAMSLGVNTSFEGIYDLKIHGGQIYAGGLYTQIGGVTISGVARWNGANWLTTLHPNRLVLALETYAEPGKACELYSAGEIFLNYWTCTTPVGEVAQMNLRIIPNPNPGLFSVELPVPATALISSDVSG